MCSDKKSMKKQMCWKVFQKWRNKQMGCNDMKVKFIQYRTCEWGKPGPEEQLSWERKRFSIILELETLYVKGIFKESLD